MLTPVTPARVLQELEALAARIGVAVRLEPFGSGLMAGRGGLCWVRGQALVVMDESMALPDRIAVLAGALAQFDLDSVYVAPLLRSRIEAASRGSKRPPRVSARRPGLARTRPSTR
jgi:hypothetical protein